jgi:hypothetical protein
VRRRNHLCRDLCRLGHIQEGKTTALVPLPHIPVDVLTRTELTQLKNKAFRWANNAANAREAIDALELLRNIKGWESFLELNPDWEVDDHI